jgi:protein O-mannosyl-transferase
MPQSRRDGRAGTGDRAFHWIAAGVLVVAIVVAYLPALDAGFIWDDDTHLTANPRVVGPLGLRETWSTAGAMYFPLVVTHFWALHAVFGLEPFPYHLVTLLLHAGCAVLLWRVLHRLAIPGAWLGAALWALHPVQVESVAWISELKNTQSGVFYLLAILFFLRWLGSPRTPLDGGHEGRVNGAYGLALLFATLAILSKPSTVMLPVVLALCWWWTRREWRWRWLLWLAPFLGLALTASAWTIWEQRYNAGAIGPEWSQTWPERFIIAGKAVWFYAAKLVWPEPLIFVYPRWSIDAGRAWSYVPLLTAAAFLLYTWLKRDGAGRHLFFAFGYFGALLFPILGFFNVYYFRYSYVADHFQYLASMGPLSLAAAGLSRIPALLARQQAAAGRPLPSGRISAGILLLALGVLTWREAGKYHDNETLFRSVLARHPECWMAHNNLGNALLNQARVTEAYASFREALRLRPEDPDALNNVGSMLGAEGRLADAIDHYERALARNPRHADAHNNLASALASVGRWDEALGHYESALRYAPRLAKAHYNWANDLFRRGAVHEAVEKYRLALAIEPGLAEAHYNLGAALAALGDSEGAATSYQRAVALRPGYAEAHNNLANLLHASGKPELAIPHYQAAIAADPGFVAALNNLGTTLRKAGRPAEAILYYEQAMRADPQVPEVHFNLGLTLLDLNRIHEAAERFAEATRLRPEFAEAHYQRALALRAAGRTEEARSALETARRLNPNLPE